MLVWSLATRAVAAKVPQPQAVTSVAWDGAARVAASGAGGTVSLIALPVPVIPDERLTRQPRLRPGRHGRRGRRPRRATVGHGQAHPAGDRHAAGRDDGQRDRVQRRAAGQPVVAVALSDGTVALLDGRKLTPLSPPFPVTTAKGPAASVAFSRDGTLLATGAADGNVRLYDVSDPAHPRRVATAPGTSGAVTAVAIAPDGATVATAGADGMVRLWLVTQAGGSGPRTLTAAGPALGGLGGKVAALAFSPDGTKLAAGAGKAVRLWDVTRPGQPGAARRRVDRVVRPGAVGRVQPGGHRPRRRHRRRERLAVERHRAR